MVFHLESAAKISLSHKSSYLEHTLMSGMVLQLNQTIENNQLHVVVAFLDDQINVTLGSSLESKRVYETKDITAVRSSVVQ